MKREALTHTKMKRLCRSLDIQLYAAVGIMESIWNLAAKESPQGDIGKLSNQDISDAIAWNGSEEKLVEALINAKWFDKDPTYRLIVHDWHEHCDDSVHMRLARLGLLFANGTKPKTTRLSMAEREKAEAVYSKVCAQQAHNKRMASENPGVTSEQLAPSPGLNHVFDRKFSPHPEDKGVTPITNDEIEPLKNKENGVCAHNKRTANALPSLAKPSLALPFKKEKELSHPYPLSPTVASLTEPQNGASALLNSSQNGKAHEPSEPELDAFSIWAHAVYQRHPKQKNLHDTLWTLKQKFANRPDDQKLLDENHPLWIAYWQLDPSYPRFVPGLADRDGRGWLNDQVWRKPPPPPPVADTKHARAKAWADKFKGETQ